MVAGMLLVCFNKLQLDSSVSQVPVKYVGAFLGYLFSRRTATGVMIGIGSVAERARTLPGSCS